MPPAQMPGTPIDAVQVGGAPAKEVALYEEAEAISPLDRRIGPIRLKGAPLSTFLDIVSAQSKVNFIITEGLEAKTITVFLRKTTVRESLELLLRVKGLTYQRIGKSNTYVVTKRSAELPNLITKIYTLNFIPLIPIASVTEDITAITSQDVTSGGGESDTTPTSGEQTITIGDKGQEKEDKTEGGIAIIKIIKSVLTKKYGKISTDPRTNSIIITDVPEVFPQIEQIIAELDKKAPQILIEAQIVEINTDRMNELGIEWGGDKGEMAFFAGPARLTDYFLRPGFFSGDSWKKFFPSGTGTTMPTGGPGGPTGGPGGTSGTPAGMGTTTGTGESTSGDTSSGGGGTIDPIYSTNIQGEGGVYLGIFSLAQLQAIFRALISKGEARYLGKPKIVAMNNKTAIIQVSQDAAVGTASSVSSNAGATSTSVERRRIGLTFRVTPQVNKEGYITLVVQPSYTNTTTSGVTVQGETVLDPVSRGAATMVRVKNGQTVVIGGMLSSTEEKTVKKVPLLGYIPIIGWFFTSVHARRKNTDLVIFLTPTILVD
jgi:type II secretory pathway component GspD/PulD (secretin)